MKQLLIVILICLTIFLTVIFFGVQKYNSIRSNKKLTPAQAFVAKKKADREKIKAAFFELYQEIILAQRAYYKKHYSYAKTFAELGIAIPEDIAIAKECGEESDCMQSKGGDTIMMRPSPPNRSYSGYGLYRLMFFGEGFSLNNRIFNDGVEGIECQAISEEGANFCRSAGENCVVENVPAPAPPVTICRIPLILQ